MKKTMFRKAVSVLTSAALLGSTIGMAAAVSYPAPFNAGNSAVVYGAQAAESDMIAATSIQSDINAALVSDASVETTVEGGESYALEKSSDKLNHGDLFSSVLPSGKLDDNDFPTLLADGIFESSTDVEHDFNQKIYLAGEKTELIVDKDLNDKEPTLGIKIADEGNILTYNITYEDALNVSTMATKFLMIGGKNYYVLTATATKLELLDTASSVTISEGDSATVVVDGVSYDVSADVYAGTNGAAVFTVNGVESDQLESGAYDKLTELSGDNDVYIVAKDVRYSSKDAGISKVEFSIGAGKITLENTKEVKINSDTVKQLWSNFSTAGLDLIWNAEQDQFLTADNAELTMPLFESIKVVYGGINMPATTEDTELVSSENYISLDTEVKDGALSLPILYRSTAATTANFTGLGEDTDSVFTTNATVANTTQSFNLTLVEDVDTSFVVTYVKGDDGYSYAFEISGVGETDGDATLDLSNLAGGADVELTELTDYVDLDDITITLVGNQTDENATIQVSTAVSGATVYADRLVTVEGMQVMLPTLADITTNGTANPVYNVTSWDMAFTEENKDQDIALGTSFTATISTADADGMHASDTSLVEVELQSDEDMWVIYSESDLASKVEMDKSGDTNTFVVMYNGEEVTVDVKIVSGDAVVSSGEAGVALLMDSESVSGKNIVVVGGSAINTVAAELVGDVRGPAFTDATGVGAGEFLIESFDHNGAVALLVAGYDAADTTKAATYLANTDDEIMVEAGKKYTGSSATEATLVTA